MYNNKKSITIYSFLLFIAIALYPLLKGFSVVEKEYKNTIVMDSVVKVVPFNKKPAIFYTEKGSGDTIKHFFYDKMEKVYLSGDSLNKLCECKENQRAIIQVGKVTEITAFNLVYALIVSYFVLSIIFHSLIAPYLKPTKPNFKVQYLIPVLFYTSFLAFGIFWGYPHIEIYKKPETVKEKVEGIYNSIETKEGVWYFYKKGDNDTYYIDHTKTYKVTNGSVVEKKKGGEYLELPSSILSGFLISIVLVLFNGLYHKYRLNVENYKEETSDQDQP